MNYTENYQLPQWEKTDRIMMEDFNEAMLKLDGSVRVVCGTYVGNSAASRSINLGFAPKAVFVCTDGGFTATDNSSKYLYGGLALKGHPLQRSGVTALQLTDSGFSLYSPSDYLRINQSNTNYHYFAIL